MIAPQLSVIVATFNEEANIENCLKRLFEVYPGDVEILVVDGGHDRTGEIVQALVSRWPTLRYVRNDNDRGKGHAIRTGIAEASGQYQAQIDADLQFLPSELPRVFEPLLKGEVDVVLGSRFMHGSVRLPGSTPFVRTLGNKIVSFYASLLFLQWLSDVQAGIKAWTKEAIQKVDPKSDNYSYEVEIAVKALKRGLRVRDVPITTDARKGGQSNVQVFTDGMALLWDITRFRLGLK